MDRPVSFADLLRTYLTPQGRRVFALGGLLFVNIALQLAKPRILGSFIDQATGGGNSSVLLQLAAVFFLVAVLRQVVAIAETAVAENVGLTATNELRSDLTRHCLDLDLSFHRGRTAGELIERVDGDIANLSNFFARFVVQLAGNAILLVATLVLLFVVQFWIGTAITAFSLVALVALYRIRNLGAMRWDSARSASAELFGFLEERIAGIEDIRSSAAVDYVLRRLADRSANLLWTQRLASVIGVTSGNVGNLLLTVMTAIGLALGAVFFRQGGLTIGAVYLVFSYTQLLNRPIEELARQLQDLQKAVASVARIRDLLSVRPSLPSGTRQLPTGALPLQLDRVTFAYGEAGPVLREVSLEVPSGQVVGLLGRTGSGKTSLARLIARFYDPKDGAIRLGGVDLPEIAPAELRRAIGLVSQDVRVFHATLRDNLTLFRRGVSDDELLAALQEVGLGEWFATLPRGLETELGSRGAGLSAGEAQLLAFARVFLRDPGVVILDEASSRIDPATERQIEAALDRLLFGRTAIIIAHRLSTVQRADRIVILDDGAIVEEGRRSELAAQPSTRFARLLRVGLQEALA